MVSGKIDLDDHHDAHVVWIAYLLKVLSRTTFLLFVGPYLELHREFHSDRVAGMCSQTPVWDGA